MNSLKPVRAKYHLGKITNKYLILDIIFCSFFRKRSFAYLHQTSKSLRQLLIENFMAAISLSEDALEHIDQLPNTISKFELPGIDYGYVNFLLLSGDRMYTSADKILFVFSVSDLSSPIATYDLPSSYSKVLISDNCLFLGASNTYYITVIEITTSLSKPLIQKVKI